MGNAVIAAGADAVYFAGETFGARAYANNFTREEAAGFLDLVHLHGKKAYLAVNTVLKNIEIEKPLYEELCYYYKAGVDAVLVQDFGVLNCIRSWFPDWTIHASTQMNITTTYGADFLYRHNVRRIVLARELSLTEIQRICRESTVEIEVFVHGALCVCYSGNCLLSSFLGGRSGNRGRCAQPCRLPYQLEDLNRRNKKMPGAFLLSPKDLCALEHIPDLLDAGVCSLKIEGRMKQPQYAATVTSMYRKYVDYYKAGIKPHTTELQQDRKILLDSGNRGGFTADYLFVHNTPKMMSFTVSSHESKNKKEIPLQESHVLVDGHFIARYQEPIRLSVFRKDKKQEEYRVSGSICDRAQNQPTSQEVVRQKLCQNKDKKLVIDDLTIEMDDDLFIPHKELKRLRREALGQLWEHAVDCFHRTYTQSENCFIQTNKTTQRQSYSSEPIVYLRVHDKKQLLTAAVQKDVKKILLPCTLAGFAQKEGLASEKLIYELPVVFRREKIAYYEEFVRRHPNGQYEISSLDALGFAERFQLDSSRLFGGYRLYMLSDQTKIAFEKLGINHGCVPLELSAKELKHRRNDHDRMLIYGRIPLMYTASCVAKNAGECNGQVDAKYKQYYLRDRKGKEFPVYCECHDCVNVLYNADTLFLLDKMDKIRDLGCHEVEFAFTTESQKEMEKVLKQWNMLKEGEKNVVFPKTYTRGHFSHSVE